MPIKTLVVDNNPVLQKAISALLEKEGCEVVTAGDGLQALEKMKTYVPDLIFTDLVMPLVDGPQLCKVVKNTKKFEYIYIVVISAIVFDEEQHIMEDVDCDLYIEKGNLKELKTHLREALEFYRKNQRKTDKVIGSSHEYADQFSITSEILLEKMHREEIVACLSEGVIELNKQGKIVEINNSALEILGFREEQVIGLDLTEIDWGNHSLDIKKWIRQELREKGMTSLEIEEEHPVFINGKVLTLTLLAVNETNLFGICILSDITRQYQAEQYNRKLESSVRLLKKMEAMSGMAGGMAHDFNNLLTVICGNLDMLKITMNKEGPNEYSHLIKQTKESAITAVELVKKISDFSPFGVIERKKHDMIDVVKDSVKTFSSIDPIKISLDINQGVFESNIDKKQIVTAIHNILQNSIDAEGGENIKISVREKVLKDPVLSSGQYVPTGDYIQISVTDNGRGIEPDKLTLIFDPYFTSKQRGNLKGMGLGLAVVYATVRNHEGYILVDSTLGKGTEIAIYLPLNRKSYVKNAADWVSGNSTNNHILMIDDDENSRHVGTVILEYLGFVVVAWKNEREILHIFEKYLEGGKQFLAAFVNLPELDSFDGVRICRKLHQLAPDLKVIAMSSSLTDPVIVDYKALGFYNIIPKPYTIDDLRSLLSMI